MSRTALVTGGHGFAASWLVKALLEEGDRVRVLDRPDPRLTDIGTPRPSALRLHGIDGEVELFEADLRDAEGIGRAVGEVDSVFHLAAQTIVGNAQASPRDTFEVNVLGTWNVMEACREHGVERVVFASSDKAYGASDQLPYREHFPLRAVHTYDASKAAA
ncbi:MAG: NAD-dependent epimerase/dehydratase family protein, partial [Solirubrobacterales bacterium]